MLRRTRKGVKIGLDIINSLLFADDITLVASSKEELQFLLNLVFIYSRKWGFDFNPEKCKVLVFTNTPWRWSNVGYYLGLDRLEVVKRYCFLGVDLSYNLSFKFMKTRLVTKVEKILPLLSKAANEGLEVKACIKFWDHAIRPILEYATEVWGLGRWDEAERVQLKCGKRILG